MCKSLRLGKHYGCHTCRPSTSYLYDTAAEYLVPVSEEFGLFNSEEMENECLKQYLDMHCTQMSRRHLPGIDRGLFHPASSLASDE